MSYISLTRFIYNWLQFTHVWMINEAVSKLYTLFSSRHWRKNMADIECMDTHQGFQLLTSSTHYLMKYDQAEDFQELLIPQSINPHR